MFSPISAVDGTPRHFCVPTPCPAVPPCPPGRSGQRGGGDATPPQLGVAPDLPAHWSILSPPPVAIGPDWPRPPHPHWPGLAPPHAEVPRPAGPWRSAAMALVLALLSQALARVWRSPGSSARHAPPSRAMEHDRAIEVYGDCTGRGGSPWGGPGLALGS